MPLVSKTVEVSAGAEAILGIVADFESYPQWNDEVNAVYVLARYDDGRPSQLRVDTQVQGYAATFIQAVYYPGPGQIQTVLQQGELFTRQNQVFSVVAMGAASLLTVDLDVETSMAVPSPVVKKLVNDALEHLAGNLKARAEKLAGA
jgi:ribosome-associated toxin RatA of RatAB toxin-antitoxin module